MITSLIYVSRSTLTMPIEAGEVDRIVAQSQARNKRLRVRGALIFTEKHFAQVLEGPAESIAELMVSIGRDKRHEAITIAGQGEIEGYRFQNWALAYRGGATFMDQQVSSLLRERDELYPQEVRRLYELIRRLAVETSGVGTIGRSSPNM